MRKSKKHQVVVVYPNYLVELGIKPANEVISEHDTEEEARNAVNDYYRVKKEK